MVVGSLTAELEIDPKDCVDSPTFLRNEPGHSFITIFYGGGSKRNTREEVAAKQLLMVNPS